MNKINELAGLEPGDHEIYLAGFYQGFKKARALIIEELKGIAAQTDEQSLLQAAVHLESFGER